MKRIEEASAQAQNPFRAEDYFSLDVRKGVIVNPIGSRMIAVPDQLMQGLEAGLLEETGSATPVILFSVGKWWGARYAKRHGAETKQFFGRELHEVPLAVYLQSLRRSWALMGLGRLELSFKYAEAGFVVADIQDTPYSAAIGKSDRPTDHLVAGVLAALISDISGRDLSCAEIACKSMGDASCRFVVGTTDRLAPVATWVKQRRSVNEILESLRSSQTS